VVSALSLSVAFLCSAQQAPAPAPAAAEPQDDEMIVLSPFVVDASKDKGYFAQNTLAGSRMQTNIADLGASISVITKQQMEDTASVDINDVFRYEVNTEGSSTYTPAGANNLTMRGDGVRDFVAGATLGNGLSVYTNASANRVRGLGTPTAAINYYPSNGQIPMDSYNVQSLEISRGPNSLLFGMGSPAGIVNQSTAQAVLNRDSYGVSTRMDDNGSYRGSFTFNQSIIKDKLAVYGAALYDHRKFERKPSYDKTQRAYGTITFKPFPKTVLRASVEGYRNDNRRPNSLTPRDYVTEWNLAGQPYYDPLTGNILSNASGKVLGNYVVNFAAPQAENTFAYLRSMPGYDASKLKEVRNNAGALTNYAYNGVNIFGDAALTTASGFSYLNNTPSANALFVPGITWANQARSTMLISDGQLVNWFQPLRGQRYRTAWGKGTDPKATADLYPTEAAIWANSTWSDMYNRGTTQSTGWTGTGNNIIGYKYPGVTDRSIYDWESINVNQMNWGQDKNSNYNIELEQQLLSNLFLTAGWFRQDYYSKTNYTVGQLNMPTLFVDTNKNMPDGTANPYFGKVYVEDQDPDRYINKSLDDHYRAMLAYTPDFTQKNGWLKWLGRHQILGLWSRDESTATGIRQRINYVDSTSFAGKARYMNNGNADGWNFQSTSIRRQFYLADADDANGVVTRASGEWNPLTYAGDIKVYDYAGSKFDTVNMTTTFNDFDAHTGRSQREIESLSAGMTNYLWNERLVTTFGVRRDDYKGRSTTNAVVYRQELSTGDATKDVDHTGKAIAAGLPVGIAPAMTNAEKWVNGRYQTETVFNRWNRWDELSGTTKTLGGVLRPFKSWNNIENRANTGSQFWQFVRSFGLSYNQSDNFNPPPSAQTDAFGAPLPKPTGEGKDYGVQFTLLDEKLFARVVWFEADNQNERTSSVTGIARLTGHMDTTAFRGWARTIARINMGEDPTSADWNNTIADNSPKDLAIRAATEPIWQQSYTYYDNLPSIGATQNAKSKGVEAEINYNPIPNWTMKLTFGKQDTSYSKVLTQFDEWYAQRSPVWQAAKASDYLLPQYAHLAKYTTSGGREVDLTNFMTSYGFNTEITLDNKDGWTNVENYYNAVVTPQVLLNRELEGQSAPGQRKYRWSYLTSYNFTEGRLNGFFVGGSQRWESKSVIGYYGKASGANGTQIDVSDITRPIYDGDNFYTDVWVGYQRRIMQDKVRMKLQLNVGNVFESGGLRPVSVNLDGTPYAFRIIDPRQFILTASFDF
jgi:outer membrane receptor protein involved in Fe transport